MVLPIDYRFIGNLVYLKKLRKELKQLKVTDACHQFLSFYVTNSMSSKGVHPTLLWLAAFELFVAISVNFFILFDLLIYTLSKDISYELLYDIAI